MNYIEIKAPAKINLGLFITSKRNDGYHNIETIFYPLNGLYDTLTFTRSTEFSFSSSDTSLNTPDNLIIKAKELIERHTSKNLLVNITLDKRIPMGAGLGGGSSDAAAALLSLNEMFNLNLSTQELRELGLKIGSDVPFFIRPRPSIGRSRGEDLSMIDFEINLPILVVNPGIHISTKEAYQNVKPRMRNKHIEDLRDINSFSDYIKDNLINDFEEYVFSAHPEIMRIKTLLINNGASFSLMSGSGSTVYGIFPDIIIADKCKAIFPDNYFTFINYDR